jgi:hypothetical protein
VPDERQVTGLNKIIKYQRRFNMEDQAMESTVEEVKEEAVEEAAAPPTEEEEAKLRQERVTACNREINATLQKYGCTLDAAITLRVGQVIPGIQIVPIELMQPAPGQAPQPE